MGPNYLPIRAVTTIQNLISCLVPGVRGSLEEYSKAATDATAYPGPLLDARIKLVPARLRIMLVSCWHPLPQSRPTVTRFLQCEFFSVGPVQALKSIDDLLEMSDPREQAIGKFLGVFFAIILSMCFNG